MSLQVHVLDWNEKTMESRAMKELSHEDEHKFSPAKIWKSKISWRIAFSVFLTILAVQTAVLTMTISSKEAYFLDEIEEIGRSSISSAIYSESQSFWKSPINEKQAENIISNTIVNGFTIYSTDLNLLAHYGEPVSMVLLNNDNLSQTHRSIDKSSYEVILRPNDLRKSYIIVAKMDSSDVGKKIISFVKQRILIMFLLSAFVTTVLMIALGKWLLEPILFLRNNLLMASKNPENPKIYESPYDPDDEIGVAITIAQKLIQQNADNIRQIKNVAEDKIHKLAYYDTLTSLPNRTLFLQNINEQAKIIKAEKRGKFAVIVIDLDHFKEINDSMGHSVGDAILRSVGKRLRSALPKNGVVSRSGEDEFAVMMPLNTDMNTSLDVAKKMASVISSDPFKIFNESFQVQASIGVATYPDDGIDPDKVLKCADIALNFAKEEGRNTIKEYSDDYDVAVQNRWKMTHSLRKALESDELMLYYQPQFDLKTQKLIGTEALLRWWKKDNSKEGGHFISPAEFIPISEHSGLIVPIGKWVIEHACKTASEWKKTGRDIRISVNVSGVQFYQGDIVETVRNALEENDLPPQNLELEVTESVFMEDVNHTIQTLKRLNELGVDIAIDDFGTGYSSLAYLRQFPIDRLKIDQSFVRNALNSPDDASIARTIIRLAHSLNMKVIAEGVETKEHEAFLIKEGCDEVQGFRYSKPRPEDEFIEFTDNFKNDLSVFDRK